MSFINTKKPPDFSDGFSPLPLVPFIGAVSPYFCVGVLSSSSGRKRSSRGELGQRA